jgi:hypothetical protein
MTDLANLVRAAMRLRPAAASFEATDNLENLLVSEQEPSAPFDPEFTDRAAEVGSALMNVLDLMPDDASTRILAIAYLFASTCYRAIDNRHFNDDQDDVTALMLVAGQIGRTVLREFLSEDSDEAEGESGEEEESDSSQPEDDEEARAAIIEQYSDWDWDDANAWGNANLDLTDNGDSDNNWDDDDGVLEDEVIEAPEDDDVMLPRLSAEDSHDLEGDIDDTIDLGLVSNPTTGEVDLGKLPTAPKEK